MASLRALTRRLAWAAASRVSPEATRDLQLGRYARAWILPRDSRVQEHYVPTHELGHLGFDLHIEDQLARLRSWRSARHQQLFRQLRQDAEINTGFNGQTYGSEALHNGYYPTPDAEIYAAMILDERPEQIVEVGSGFSTLVAHRAIDYGDLDTKLTVIDPHPRTTVNAAADEVIRACIEDVDLDVRSWSPKSILLRCA
jgi:hypothetical protein